MRPSPEIRTENGGAEFVAELVHGRADLRPARHHRVIELQARADRTTWSTPRWRAEESGETEGAVLRYIATAEDQRLAEAAMREFHDRMDTYTRGLAREYLR